MNEDEYIPIRKAAKLVGLTTDTLRTWSNKGILPAIKTPSGQRLYHRESILAFIGNGTPSPEKKNYIYCRVSSKKQTDDLQRQIDSLRALYPNHELISDCASGINFKRKGLKTILEQSISKHIGEIVVAHKDRLARFGFDLLEMFIGLNGGKITVLDGGTHLSTEQELAEDLLSIIHIFTCRQMGKRRYKTKPFNEEEEVGQRTQGDTSDESTQS